MVARGQDMALPPCEQKYKFLRYEGLEYPDTDIANFEGRLARIHKRGVHRVPVFDFGGLPDLMAEGLRWYLRLFSAGRKSGAHISGGQFVARLAEHFGLLTAEILGGLTVIAPELPIIDMTELVRLHICVQFDDTWALVAMGPERQLVLAAWCRLQSLRMP
ncbi:hypothetical protein Tco_0586520 [Tanacetum coccineum]